MKHIKKISIVFIVLSAVLISGCSKYKLYNMAIDSRRSSADLVIKKVVISIGEIVYLDNAPVKQDDQDQEVIIMIHGFGANKDNWLLLSDEMTDDYRIIVPDLPGHGESISDKSLRYTIENQAKWLGEFMETLQIKKAHLIGNSMGGAITVKLTHLYPGKVISLTLLDSAGVRKTESEYAKLLKKGINPLVVGNPEEYKKLMNFVMEKKPYIPGPVISVLTERKIARKSIDKKIFQDIMLDITRVETLLLDIQTPTLILWGDKDRVLHVDNAEEFHLKIKGSQKVILEGVGHMPMIEVPQKTGEYYRQFLSSLRA